jgi:hypothetical protein
LIVIIVLLIGLMRQVAALPREAARGTTSAAGIVPSIDDEGPAIGTLLPAVSGALANGEGVFLFPSPPMEKELLIAILSPHCETYQSVIEPLSAVHESRESGTSVVALVQGAPASAANFVSAFAIRFPVIADPGLDLTRGAFAVSRNPFGLLYGRDGRLVRKGVLSNGADSVRALLGDASADPSARFQMYPEVRDDLREPVQV